MDRLWRRRWTLLLNRIPIAGGVDMMPSSFSQLVARSRERKGGRRVAVIAADDAHTLEAVQLAVEEGGITPVLIGNASRIAAFLAGRGVDAEALRIIDIPDPVAAARAAVGLVHAGKVEALMKGRIETATMMKVIVDKTSDLRTGRIMSHLAMLEIPSYHKLLAITDVALNTSPDVAHKRQIIENAVAALSAMGIDNPKVAVMASAEQINPKLIESVDAAELKRLNQAGEITGCIVEGPISYDLAIDREAVAIKRYRSPVAADADLMVVPNLVAGNLLVKALIFSARAKFAGFIVGAKVPIVVTSRSSPTTDKYMSMVLAAAACPEFADA
ncbi:MAG: bifunctional enoyl-CoA hydratase/phosphate acetyltransferase [Acetobacteraceae bacterium]|nr:bifunctional enoyl-CoA hydratase/phosphate acetyltransferase [Acetobacteraceae bacterium]